MKDNVLIENGKYDFLFDNFYYNAFYNMLKTQEAYPIEIYINVQVTRTKFIHVCTCFFQSNFDAHEILKQETSRMSKIIGELSARVRRKLFEEELQKNSSPEEQQNKNSPVSLRNDEFYDSVVDQNETVAEFLDLCNNNNNGDVTNNSNQNHSIDLTSPPTTRTENQEIKKSIDVSFFELSE